MRWRFIYDLIKEVHLLLIRHLYVEDFSTGPVLSRQLEHLDVVLDHILGQHAVAEVFDLVFHALHSIFVVSEHVHLLRVAEQELSMVPAS